MRNLNKETKTTKEKLEQIKNFFLIPLFIWFLLAAIKIFCLILLGDDQSSIIRTWISQATFYILPLLLFYYVILSFLSNHMLGPRSYKNIIAFTLIQAIIYYLIDVMGLRLPEFDKTHSFFLTLATSVIVYILLKLIIKKIGNPNESFAFFSKDELKSIKSNSDLENEDFESFFSKKKDKF